MIPSFSNGPTRWTRDGLQEFNILSNVWDDAEVVERMVLMGEPSFVGWNEGRVCMCGSTGVDDCIASVVLMVSLGGFGGGVGGSSESEEPLVGSEEEDKRDVLGGFSGESCCAS